MKKEIHSCCATGKTPVHSEQSNPVAECFGGAAAEPMSFLSYVLIDDPPGRPVNNHYLVQRPSL